ncbi:MAG: GlsB/YeaQ/YmgE family stress response membrane protein [Ardenticatenales bacterium]|nr:GlsB/YeaQ/YmgE family stress response membrane protein [Ardenticatenales bacterium]
MDPQIQSWIVLILVGAVAGWLGKAVVGGYAGGLLETIIIGIVGAFIGNWLQPMLKLPLPAGIVGTILIATLGAIVLLVILRLIRRAR